MDRELSVYVSYSHADRAWKERLVEELRALRDDGRLGNWSIWDDSHVSSGARWEQALNEAMDAAQAAILLISAPYLESSFVTSVELPRFLKRRESGFLVLPVLVARSDWQSQEWLRDIQLLPRDLKPLAERDPKDAESELQRTAREISEVLRKAESALSSGAPLPTESATEPSEQESNQRTRDSDLWPLGDIGRRYRFSPTAREIMDGARALAERISRTATVTSSCLLFAMVDQGRSRGAYDLASFLWNYIVERGGTADYEDVRSKYLRRQEASGEASKTVGQTAYEAAVSQGVTHNAVAVLEQAWILAQRLDEAEIHARHLLAGLLVDQTDDLPQGAHRRLQELGIDRSALGEAFLSHIESSTGERHRVWEEFLLGRAGDLRRLSGYAADAARGADLIGISRDVSAFATLIAAQSVRPPLAIGLFGEWGSGKTFFMNQLRAAVDSLAKEMNETDKMQRELPFYKRIVQIEFNAWHYVQGELWPSLMQHLLDNLQLPGEQDSASQKLRNHLIQKLQEESIALGVAERAVKDAEEEIKQAEQEASTAREELKDKEKELRETSVRVDLQDFLLPEIKDQVDGLLNALGMAPVSAAARDLGNALQEARSELEHGYAVLTPLVRAEDRARRWRILLLGLVAAPLVGLLIGLIPALLGQEALAQTTTLATGGATLIGVLTAWLRSQTTWLKERLDKADAIQRQYDAQVTEKLAEYTERVREQEDELSRLRGYLAATERKREEAERRVAEAQGRLERATTTNLLADFIQDRAASQDYRKHLGVLALIRNDFEKLSNLMEAENWRLAPPSPNDDAQSYTDKKYTTLEEEKEGETERINRIVLYIDDLDRCPPKVVTDVLQAVHLLLAFPLFVVVVAVDARWIKRSLRARYDELLHIDGHDSEQDGSEEIFGKATPDDYLEKIFQIPFWLKPIGKDASQRMLEGLLQDSLVDNTLQDQEVRATKTESADEPAGTSFAELPDDRSVTQPSQERADRVPTERQPGATQESQVRPDPLDSSTASDVYIDPTRLQITSSEMDFITELTPLLGRSPRALKRFVNVYRLIKAGLSEREDRRFLMESPALSDYQAVLFLLAVDTGLPDIAEDFFDGLQSTPERKSLHVLIDGNLGKADPGEAEQWSRLREWLLRVDTTGEEARQPRLPDDVKILAAWKRRVLRYSFRTNQS